MFPREIWKRPVWCLYDTIEGRIILTHPCRPGLNVPCPHCGQRLVIEDYRAECCGKTFRTGFGGLTQCEPVGNHNKTSGRGWSSLRPYRGTDQATGALASSSTNSSA